MAAPRARKVFVAVSGGVDSSVALTLLRKAGYDVVGCFMKNWSESLPGLQCNWVGDREDAIRVCAALGVPFKTVDLEKAYRKRVFAYFINEYKKGRTPNPDVICNSEIKFKAFLHWARRNGADMIATGHYARLQQKTREFRLFAAKDKNKDQSYFLYRLGQEELRHTLFPIGGYAKPEVRAMARRFGLATAAKPDSQGVCFVGEVTLREFLKNWIPEKRGKIILLGKRHSDVLENIRMSRAQVIGEHPGVWYFTIGQRHGLGLKGGVGEPLYVVKKDVKKNILYVGPKSHPLLYRKELLLADVHWVSGRAPKLPVRCRARIRYRQPLQSCQLWKSKIKNQKSKFRISFNKPQWAPASGQSVVFYQRDELRGGGVLAGV